MPAGFRGVSDLAELWRPFMMSGTAENMAERGNRGMAILARLKPGVPLTQAQAELDTICRALERQYPKTNEARGVEVAPLDKEIFGEIRPAALALLGAVACAADRLRQCGESFVGSFRSAAKRDRAARGAGRRTSALVAQLHHRKLRARHHRRRRGIAARYFRSARPDGREPGHAAQLCTCRYRPRLWRCLPCWYRFFAVW